MQIVIFFLCFVGGLAVGWFIVRSRQTALAVSLREREEANRVLEQKLSVLIPREAELSARLEGERASVREKQTLLEDQVTEVRNLREKVTTLVAKESDVSARLQSEQSTTKERSASFEVQVRARDTELRGLREQVNLLSIEKSELATRFDAERQAVEEKLRLLSDAEKKLTDVFKAVSADALSRNNQAFLDLARMKLAEVETAVRGDLEKRQQAISELVAPVRASLDKVDDKIQQIERIREGAYSELREQVRGLGESQIKLQVETGKLVTALRAPAVRGRWGEIQLQRVVEMAGMLENCDFFTQPTADSDDGRLRPDLLVRLPGGKSIVVDAKAPLAAYLSAIEATDEPSRKRLMQNHAAQVRVHVQALGRKSYSAQFQPAPDFVVLFLPGESFFSAALENDPTLIEYGLDQNVVLATPTTLIALLRTASYGWQQESLARNAAEISALGKELYRRISGMIQHWAKVGVNLGRAVHAYNSATSSLESRVLVSARKFEDLKTAPAGMDIKTVLPVERTVRVLVEGGNGLPELDEILTDNGNTNPAGASFEGANAEELHLDHSIGPEDEATISAPDSVSAEPAKAFVQLPWWQQNNLS
jgi:DNA recombination protein RmuC